MATQTNAEFSRMAEKRVAEWNENFVSLLDKAVKNAPAGSDVLRRYGPGRAEVSRNGAPDDDEEEDAEEAEE